MAKSNNVKKQFYFYFPRGVFNILTNGSKIQLVHLMNFSYFSVSEWHYFELSNNCLISKKEYLLFFIMCWAKKIPIYNKMEEPP